MSLGTTAATYLIVWWVVLFTVLPMGVVSHAEAGVRTPAGGDPGSPVDPKLKRKFVTTTWVSALLYAPFWIAVHFHWLSLGTFRNFG
jgi:predicted secreted protein